MSEYVKYSIEKWNRKLSDITNKEEKDLLDLSFWVRNPQSLLIFDSVDSIVVEIIKNKFNFKEIDLKLIKDGKNYNLEIYFYSEEEPRLILDIFYHTYKVFSQPFNSNYWTKKLEGNELAEINKVITDIEKLLKYPRLFRFLVPHDYLYSLSTSYLKKHKKDMENWIEGYDKVIEVYESRKLHFGRIEEVVENIGNFLEENIYRREKTEDRYYL